MGKAHLGLVDIIRKPEWERQHRLRAIEIDGKCPVADELGDLARIHKDDFDKLMKVVHSVADNHRVVNPRHVKQGRKHRSIYEMRGGHARLFFFYTADTDEVVVCTHYYWKTKPSIQEQNEAFEKADRLRRRYCESESSVGNKGR